MSTDATEDIEDIEDPGGDRTYSYAYLTALFLTLFATIVAAVRYGYIPLDVTVTARLNIGWILEYALAALAGMFLFWTFAQIANIVGMGFIGGVVDTAARIMDAYELPGEGDRDRED